MVKVNVRRQEVEVKDERSQSRLDDVYLTFDIVCALVDAHVGVVLLPAHQLTRAIKVDNRHMT